LLSGGALVFIFAASERDARPSLAGVAQSQAPRTLGPQPPAARPRPSTAAQTKPTPEAKPEPTPKQAEPTAGTTRESPLERAAREQAAQQRQAEEAEQDRKRHALIEAELNARALAAARRNVSIVMYSTSWCGACAQARQYMHQQNLSFIDHDVEQDPGALARAHQLNPRHSVPVIDVEGDVSIGFSPSHLEASLDRAARKRVGL
jgi:glutaredoxin